MKTRKYTCTNVFPMFYGQLWTTLPQIQGGLSFKIWKYFELKILKFRILTRCTPQCRLQIGPAAARRGNQGIPGKWGEGREGRGNYYWWLVGAVTAGSNVSEECQDGVMVERSRDQGGREAIICPPPSAEGRAQAGQRPGPAGGGSKLKAASWVCLSVCASVPLCVTFF